MILKQHLSLIFVICGFIIILANTIEYIIEPENNTIFFILGIMFVAMGLIRWKLKDKNKN